MDLYYSSHSNPNLFKLFIINTCLVKAKKMICYYPNILLICIATCYGNKKILFSLIGNKHVYTPQRVTSLCKYRFLIGKKISCCPPKAAIIRITQLSESPFA